MSQEMNWIGQIQQLQIDATSYCNAACPLCGRYDANTGKKASWLKLQHLDVELWRRLITQDLEGINVQSLLINGNWGDPIMHPDFIDIVKIYQDQFPNGILYVATNGGVRSHQWWHDLATVMDRSNVYHEMQVAVDGLADTHSYYRRDTDFDTVIRNIETFNKAGGSSCMVVTLFDHNINQIDELRQLAKDIGCQKFSFRLSHNAEVLRKNFYGLEHDVTTNNITPEFQKKMHMRWGKHVEELKANPRKQWDLPLQGNTQCVWYNEGNVFVDNFGTVWPCCHTAFHAYAGNQGKPGLPLELREQNNLHNYTLKEILNNDWFKREIPQAVDSAAWPVCVKKCGVKNVS